MKSYKDDIVTISDKTDLIDLVQRIKNRFEFARAFKFDSDELLIQFFEALDIDLVDFEKKYYFYDSKTALHISESEFQYFWISTIGIVGKEAIGNKYFCSLRSQNLIIDLLFEKAFNLCNEDTIYDVDSISFDYITDFTPALFHNVLFYFELLSKAYLSLNNVRVPKTHNLSKLYSELKETMFKLNHNNTIFHARIVTAFNELVKYISTIPGEFKEQFVKYNDNNEASTAIIFERDRLEGIKNTLDLSYDFICNYNYDINDTKYLEKGLFNRLISKAKNEDEKKKITLEFSYLLK